MLNKSIFSICLKALKAYGAFNLLTHHKVKLFSFANVKPPLFVTSAHMVAHEHCPEPPHNHKYMRAYGATGKR